MPSSEAKSREALLEDFGSQREVRQPAPKG